MNNKKELIKLIGALDAETISALLIYVKTMLGLI